MQTLHEVSHSFLLFVIKKVNISLIFYHFKVCVCTVCIYPYSSFIIVLNPTKIGMYTLLQFRNAVRLCCNKKS
jgi:hypothetical protein